MIEKVYTFGTDSCLTGIVTEPDVELRKKDKPAVLIPNAGILHRVGPYRLHVDLARKLADNGSIVLRFDLSGLGDSAIRMSDILDEDRTITDIKQAMDFLIVKSGFDRFVLIGLCSGADNAHKCAIIDERVVGAVFLDGYGYPTWKFYIKRYGSFLLNPYRMMYSLKRIFNIVTSGEKEKNAEVDGRTDIYFWKMPPQKKVEADLRNLIERRVNLLYIYSRGAYKYFNYNNQFGDMFRYINFRSQIDVKYFDTVDHLYTLLEDRNTMIKYISNWMDKTYFVMESKEAETG